MNQKQEAALREYLQEAIVPLIEDVLAKKLGQAMTFAAQELIQSKREWVGLTDGDVREALEDFPRNFQEWYDRDFIRYTRAIETKLKEKNT